MLSDHKLLGSVAGPEELAEGPEGLSTLAPALSGCLIPFGLPGILQTHKNAGGGGWGDLASGPWSGQGEAQHHLQSLLLGSSLSSPV